MNTGTKHLFYAFVALLIALVLSYLGITFADDVLAHPGLYFDETLTTYDVAYMVLVTSTISISVLISAVFYLLLAGKVRAEVAGQKINKDLAVSIEFFGRLYDYAPIPYMLLSSRGVIDKPNKAALRLFGVVEDQLLGKDIFSFHPEESEDQGAMLREKLWRHIPIDREEIQFVRADGTSRWILLSIFKFKNPGQSKHNALATLVDITEQKQLELAKTEFVSLASHQLRTPLAAMKWHSDLLLSGDIGNLPEKQRSYVEKMHRSNEVMIDLVNTLLSISRLEVGKLEPEIGETNAVELAQSVIEEMTPQLEEKKIIFEHTLDDSFTSIKSDPKLLRIVIQNLMSNAIKYTPEGGTVKLFLKKEGGDKQIVVSDNGIGIPQEAQEKIFNKMYRTDNAKKVDTKGTGLGLYLVRSIIDLFGGKISFVSEEGKGTTFTAVLP